MTTILFTPKLVLWDSQVTSGSIRYKAKHDKVRIIDDVIFATAGDVGACQALPEWWMKGGEPTKVPKGSWEMVVWKHKHPPRYYHNNDNLLGFEIPLPFSIGSGGIVASIALDAGLNPYGAMKLAYKRDVYSSGPTRTIHVEKFFTKCSDAKRAQRTKKVKIEKSDDKKAA